MQSRLLVRILAQLSEIMDCPLKLRADRALSGGSICQAHSLDCGDYKFFIKYHQAPPPGMFRAEAAALREIAMSGMIRVPEPLIVGDSRGIGYIVLEHLDLCPRDRHGDFALGRALAAMHQQRQPYFGWTMDNYCGSTPQPNPEHDDWLTFFVQHRLLHQVQLLRAQGADLTHQANHVVAGLEQMFDTYRPQPSLLHGDLWTGNAGQTQEGAPVVFDPACYYGDRETDLAMAELFGGFGQDFYDGYDQVWPRHPGYAQRRKLYQLYHVLNHANLFGGGYIEQAIKLMQQLQTPNETE